MTIQRLMKASLPLLVAAAALAAAPAVAAGPSVCLPLVNPNPGTNCVEVQPSPGFCLASYYPNQSGSTGTYVGCSYAGSGSVCAAAQYTPSTGYNEGYGCVNVLDACTVGVAVTTHDDSDFFCVA